ncbi:hypothetical protein ACFVJ4_38810 [Streptomyces sp. NPDC127178]
MTAVMVELRRKPAPVVQDPDDVVLVAGVEALTEDTVPSCDDNPYN